MARVADFVLRHEQAHAGHVALGHGDVTNAARISHRGVHRFPADLGGVTGRTFRALRNAAWMLHRECWRDTDKP